jgi:hypothetical protein
LAGGDRNHEEFADMYLNWVLGTFTTPEEERDATVGAGNVRQTWMNTHMAGWLDLFVDKQP